MPAWSEMLPVTADPWLTEVFQSAVFRVDLEGGGWDPAYGRCALSEPGFYYAKVSTRDLARMNGLVDLGFRIVDVSVQLERKPEPLPESSVEVRAATPGDAEDVLEVAGSCFVYSRFHQDPLIAKELANRLKREWMHNCLEGRRGDGVLVAVRDGRAVGFLATVATGQPAGRVKVLDLIGVAPQYQGEGIGRALVSEFIRRSTGAAEVLRVGTQVANIPSVRLYEQSGFRFSGSSYVLHAHVKGK